jgi:hypothetical protein
VAGRAPEKQRSQEWHTLSREELENLAGERLSERAARSLIDANVAIPANAALAADVLADTYPAEGRSSEHPAD